MTSHTSVQHNNFFFSFFQNISPFGKTKTRTKTHNLRAYREDVDYSVDFADSYNSAYMITAINVRTGEHIILTDLGQTLKYCAETVDRYSNSNRLREIRLKRILQQVEQ